MHAHVSLPRQSTITTHTPVFQFRFGEEPRDLPCPAMRLGGDASGNQIITVPAAVIRDIEVRGRLVGRAYSDDHASYCFLAGIVPPNRATSPEREALQCFEALDEVLHEAEMSFRHVVRTWFYLDHLLEWYNDFNAVRSAYFREHGVFNHLVPASTGIGAANAFGAALVAGAIAIRPKSDRVRICPVQSPLQCPAIDYRSAFSRAVEVTRPDLRQLYVSGTASIAPDGQSMHVGNCSAQIDRTMEVIGAILRSRRIDWADSTRMIAYLRDLRDARHFWAWCRQHGVIDPPVIFVKATVCRDELLFELELDAEAQP